MIDCPCSTVSGVKTLPLLSIPIVEKGGCRGLALKGLVNRFQPACLQGLPPQQGSVLFDG